MSARTYHIFKKTQKKRVLSKFFKPTGKLLWHAWPVRLGKPLYSSASGTWDEYRVFPHTERLHVGNQRASCETYDRADLMISIVVPHVSSVHVRAQDCSAYVLYIFFFLQYNANFVLCILTFLVSCYFSLFIRKEFLRKSINKCKIYSVPLDNFNLF